MKITENGVLLTNNRTGQQVAVEGGRVYDNATRIDITGCELANSAIEHLKRCKEALRDKIGERKQDEWNCDVYDKQLEAVKKALYGKPASRAFSFENKLMYPIKAMLQLGYSNCEVDAATFSGTPAGTYFGVCSDDILVGEYMWIYVREEDYDMFKEIAVPDREYKNKYGQIIFLFKV